jgi:hypothetical protein
MAFVVQELVPVIPETRNNLGGTEPAVSERRVPINSGLKNWKIVCKVSPGVVSKLRPLDAPVLSSKTLNLVHFLLEFFIFTHYLVDANRKLNEFGPAY